MSKSSAIELSKPLDASSLVATIRMLPPLPEVAQKILDKFSDEFIRGDEIAGIVDSDPAISARLFALANSAYFGLTTPVSDMREVVQRVLGPDTVRSLAFALAADRTFSLSGCPSFNSRLFWHRALYTAAGARRIARVVDGLEPSEQEFAYLGGLCHNLGLLAIACCYPSDTDRMLDQHANEPESELEELCLDQFGFHIRDVSFELAFAWGLPEPIFEAYRALSMGTTNENLLATVLETSVGSARYAEQPLDENVKDHELVISERAAETLKITPEKLKAMTIGSDRQRNAAESTLQAMVGV